MSRIGPWSARAGRGRSVVSGLALATAFTVGCGAEGPGPVSEPISNHTAPLREATPDGARVVNHGAAERLTVYRALPRARPVTLLFLGGRAATPLDGGGSAWADMDEGRLVRFDEQGLVAEVLTGVPEDGAPLTRPAFATLREGVLAAVEPDGQELPFIEGEARAWLPGRLPAAATGGRGGVVAATRTIFDLHLMAPPEGAPLLWASDARGTRGMGKMLRPEQSLLAHVVNAGWVAPDADGWVAFASAVRPEVHLYDPAGELAWIATWPETDVQQPTFKAVGGALAPSFRIVQQATVIGPDGRVYVLAVPPSGEESHRLLVFDREGGLLRQGSVDGEGAVYVSATGHVFTLEPSDAFSRIEPGDHGATFEAFDLPALEGPGRVRLADHVDKILVVNFWASWCTPCRREMPLLDAWSRELDSDRAVILGLNEDVTPADALAFLEELGGVGYLNAEGRGQLRETYGYRGLPFTVVLDHGGRLLRAFYGFGESIDPLREVVEEALAAD